ncbi:MAG: glycosyltransferase family 2 protein [Thermoproteales archaeon]|nr:glycosyltransferase family 2 protein [Thermoproteales archaeon]
MRVSVVVAAARLDDSLRRLLKSLESQTLKPWEVLVLAPAGKGDAAALVRETSLNVKVIELRRDPGPIRARVFGALAASSPLIAFIDSDCVAPPDWLRSLVSDVERAGVDVVAGSVEGVNLDSFVSRLQERSLISPNPKHGYKLLKGDLGLSLVVTANMLVRREALIDDEVIPPSYGRFGFEDLDFAYRLLRRGHRILCSPTRVGHFNRESLTRVLKRYYEYGRGLPLFRRRAGGCTYSRAITALSYSLIAVLAAAATLALLGYAWPALALASLPLAALYAYHLSRLGEGGYERLAYPLLDLLLALTAVAGALHSELEFLLRACRRTSEEGWSYPQDPTRPILRVASTIPRSSRPMSRGHE